MKRFLILIGVLALAAGCGGGGGHVTPPTALSSSAPVTTGKANARVTVTIPAPPKTSSQLRKPRYVSSATNSMTVRPQGGTATVIPLTPTSPGCTTASDGSRTCVVNLDLQAGTNVVFTVQTFASSDGSGSPLSVVTATQTVIANQVNPINLTLNAVVGSVNVAFSPPTAFIVGQAGSRTVIVTVLDPAQQIIVVPQNALVDANGNAVTITVTDTDTSGKTTLSSTTLGSSPITLTYGGSGSPSGAVTATATQGTATVATVSYPFFVEGTSSLYVLSGYDSVVAEFPFPVPTGTSTPAPVRVFGGSAPLAGVDWCPPIANGLPPDFGNDAMTSDPSGNIWVMSDMIGCNTWIGATNSAVYPIAAALEFPPSAGPSFVPVNYAEDTYDNVNYSGHSPTVVFDAANNRIATADNGGGPTGGFLIFNEFTTSGSPVQSLAENWSGSPPVCLIPPTAPIPANSSSCDAVNKTLPVFYPANELNEEGYPQSPVVFDARGTQLAMFAFDENAATSKVYSPLTFGQPAVVLFSPNPPAGQPWFVTAPRWIEGPDTLLNQTVSMAVDERNILYVLDSGQPDGGIAPNLNGPGYCVATAVPPSAPQCSDGAEHQYLLAFDLNALENGTGPCAAMGACDLPPMFVLGGSDARFGQTSNSYLFGGNMLAAHGGYVFVANPVGPHTSNISWATGQGEVDVYTTGVTGVHLKSDAAPYLVAVLPAQKYINNPISVAIGKPGTCTGTCVAGLRRAEPSRVRVGKNIGRRRPRL